MKISRQIIIGTGLLLLSGLIGHTTETGFSIGDRIFLGLGLSPWSNGQTGFHYPVIISFLLLIIGCLEAKRVMPVRQLLVLLLLLSFVTPTVVSSVKPFYYRMHIGLASVAYDIKKSNFSIRSSEDHKGMEILGAVVLTNYGKDIINFGIKIPADDFLLGEYFSQGLLLSEVNNTQPGNFILHPGETRTFLSYNEVSTDNDFNGQGNMNGPNLILFTDDETREVGFNL